ncbi:MAG: IclR family transcriptional regulator [Gammaproteobacteria bacterium]
MKGDSVSGTGGVMAIRLVLSIIERLAKQESVGVTELSRLLGTTKARVFRHLRTLVDQGYAAQDSGTDRYAAGPRLVGLAYLAGLTPANSLLKLARPTMIRLRDQFGHSVNLSLVYGDSVSIVESLQGSSFVGVAMRTHMPMPLHSTAAGKLLLSEMHARKKRLPGRPYKKFTENSITDSKALLIELDRIRKRGWACAPEETVLGINAISAPIHDHRGELVAMISLVGSIQFITRRPSRLMIDAIKHAAAEISAALNP